jgi:hypothetical protein
VVIKCTLLILGFVVMIGGMVCCGCLREGGGGVCVTRRVDHVAFVCPDAHWIRSTLSFNHE